MSERKIILLKLLNNASFSEFFSLSWNIVCCSLWYCLDWKKNHVICWLLCNTHKVWGEEWVCGCFVALLAFFCCYCLSLFFFFFFLTNSQKDLVGKVHACKQNVQEKNKQKAIQKWNGQRETVIASKIHW